MQEAAIAFQKSNDSFVLAFRGTTTTRENLVDASALLSREKDGVVDAFAAAYARSGLRDQVDALHASTGASVHFISGHSLGGAFATLAAQQCVSAALVTWAGARTVTPERCRASQARGTSHLAVVNAQDAVPFLHSLVASSCQCCPVVLLNAAPSSSLHSRLLTHDILYYGYALLLLGSLGPREAGQCGLSALCAPAEACFLEVEPFPPFAELMRALPSPA